MTNKFELIKSIEKENLKDISSFPEFIVGDTVKIHTKIVEGKRERIQVFEGVVIARKGSGFNEMIKIRKVSFGEGVERTFPLHSPMISKIELGRKGSVRRSKLFYLRDKIGKKAQVKRLDETIKKETAPAKEAE